MSPTELPTVRRRAGFQGRHVLFVIVGFFGVIFAVNGVLIYYALATHSGLVAQEPYRKGLTYNARIAADERQEALGWSSDIRADAQGRISLVLADAAGSPIGKLTVKGLLGRPSANRNDVDLAFTEQSPGTYVAQAGPMAAGVWLVNIEARGGSARPAEAPDPVFRARRRLWLEP